MSTPPILTEGLLAYGQAGEYDAHDDRLVVAALAGRYRRRGLVTRPSMVAGVGLRVNCGPWMGIVDAADGTSAVIGTREPWGFDLPAGGPAAATLFIWADALPDEARWEVRLMTLAQTVGRIGLILGRVIVPANANTAGAMTILPWEPPMQLGESRTDFQQSRQDGNTGWGTRVAFRIPPGDMPIQVGAGYELEAWGNAWQPLTSTRAYYLSGFLRAADPGDPTPGTAGTTLQSVRFGSTVFTNGSQFRWKVRVRIFCTAVSGDNATWVDTIEGVVGPASDEMQVQVSPSNNNFAVDFNIPRSQGNTTLDRTGVLWLHIRDQWASGWTGNAPYSIRRIGMLRKIAGMPPEATD